MVNSKAQMKIQQMAFMLIAVFVLFILVGFVILAFRVSNLKETALEYEEQNALTLASKIANSPEFSCGNSFGSSKSNCVDLDKLMGLKEHAGNYEDFLEVSNIEIRVLYPEESEVECTWSNYPDCNYFDLYGKGIVGFSASNFVSVCHKEINGNEIADKCELGKIIISYGENDGN